MVLNNDIKAVELANDVMELRWWFKIWLSYLKLKRI
jgi:hypothetical protein